VAGFAVVAGLLLATTPTPLRAQEPLVPVNRAYVELFGAGILYSVNYEVTLSDRIGLRLGVGGLPFSGASYVAGVAMPTMLFGRGAHKAVVAGGVGLGWIEDIGLFESQEQFEIWGVGSIGYQLQTEPRGFFVRVAFTPIFAEGDVSPWGGVSFGSAF
jgi:hypothetical protein